MIILEAFHVFETSLNFLYLFGRVTLGDSLALDLLDGNALGDVFFDDVLVVTGLAHGLVLSAALDGPLFWEGNQNH